MARSLATAGALLALVSLPAFCGGSHAPRGWNSWDCCDHSDEEQVLKAARFMNASLLQFGFDHVVVDIGWHITDGEPSLVVKDNPASVHMDANGRLYPSPKLYPSSKDNGAGFRHLSDRVHAMGLKFGWHIMRGIPKEAVRRKLPIAGSNYTADQAALEGSDCAWNHWMTSVNTSHPAGKAYYRSLARLYVEWGADLIKADCFYTDVLAQFAEVATIADAFKAEALKPNARPVMLSWVATPVNYTTMDLAVLTKLRPHGSLFRIGNDLWDDWEDLSHQMDVLPAFAPFQSSEGPPGFEHFGSWADPDMLPLGRVGHPDPREGKPYYPQRQSNLTADEQTTLVTLWLIFRAPLFFGGDLSNTSSLHPATRSLITNNETLAVQRDARSSRQVSADRSAPVWSALDAKAPNTSRFVAVFNKHAARTSARAVHVGFASLGLPATARCRVRDLWARKELGVFAAGFGVAVAGHGARMLSVNVVHDPDSARAHGGRALSTQ